MERTLFNPLKTWLFSPSRKPLVLRGARQVGKTWLIRYLAKECGKKIIELNFEKNPSYASLFAPNDPQKMLLNLTTIYNDKIDPENCLLFLDEIQAVPHLFSKLRWFAEDLPQLPVVAAGSLLEFVLANHSFSMPVGRISYMHLEPLSFEEFLLANDKPALMNYLTSYDLNTEIPLAIHEQLIGLFKEYLMVGGLPAAVENWTREHSPHNLNQIHHDLLATYRDDFSKFNSRLAIEKLEDVMIAIPKMLGEKIVFSRIHTTANIPAIKNIFDLLSKARICHYVWSCSANGVPLAAEVNEKYFKAIFLDTGLCCAALGLELRHFHAVNDITLINQGGISEQVVGQLLRTITSPYIEPALYYWLRHKQSSNAEVDYVIQYGNKVIPIEVKAGSTGSLKSLHLFMAAKKSPIAIRVNSDLPSQVEVHVKDHAGNLINYPLLSLPFYLVGQLYRLLRLNDEMNGIA